MTRHHMDRKLGAFEKFMDLFHGMGTMLIVVLCRLRGPVSPDVLGRALRLVQARHPMLRARIVDTDDGPFFRPMREPGVLLEVVDRRNDDQCYEIWEEELPRQLPRESGPLWRATYLCSAGDESSELVLTFHHSIIDLKSITILVGEVLSMCHKLIAGAETDVTEMSPPPPFEDIVGSEYTRRQAMRDFVRSSIKKLRPVQLIVERQAASVERRSRIIKYMVGEETTSALLQRCKAEGTAMNGALCAAMLFSAARILDAGAPVRLSCGCAVNLERYAASDDWNGHIKCAASGMMNTTHTLARKTLFWDLARNCRKALDTGTRRKVPMNAHLVMEKRGLDASMLRRIAEVNGGRSGTVHVSNGGVVRFPGEFDSIAVTDLYFATGIHALGDCAWMGALSLHGRLYCSFVMVEPLVSDRTARGIAATTVEALKKAVAAPRLVLGDL